MRCSCCSRSTRKYSCSQPRVACTCLTPASLPKSFRMRIACFDIAWMERRCGVFLSRASPVQLTKAVGMQSVTIPEALFMRNAGLVQSQAV